MTDDKTVYKIRWVTGIEQYVDSLDAGYELCPDKRHPNTAPSDTEGVDMYRVRLLQSGSKQTESNK